MRAPRIAIAMLLALGLLALSSLELTRADAQPGRRPIAVIVSAQATVRDLSGALLRRIFQGEPTEHQGTRYVPLNYPPSDPLRVAFDRAALGFTPEDAGRYWVDRRIRGQGLPPRSINGQKLMRNVVARLTGGISYVTPDQLDGTVRAVTIDGKSHMDPGYPLLLKAP